MQERNDRPLKSGEVPGPATSDFMPTKPAPASNEVADFRGGKPVPEKSR